MKENVFDSALQRINFIMDLKWDYKLKSAQRSNPVIHSENVTLPTIIPIPTDEEMSLIFKTKSYILQTWGRAIDKNGKTILTNNAHWIAVRGQTVLHYDPKYPRYSHHLKIRVDDGISVRGLSKEELILKRGVFYILDTHSPHQVLSKNKNAYNIAVSIDAHEVINPKKAITKCIDFALRKTVYDDIK